MIKTVEQTHFEAASESFSTSEYPAAAANCAANLRETWLRGLVGPEDNVDAGEGVTREYNNHHL